MAAPDKIHVLGIAGSLRKASYNRAALRAAQELAPDGVEVEAFDLEGIPLFNEDEERQPQARVSVFKSRIRAADAILIVTPEYNYSVPGVLKNALDYGSRPYGDNSWNGKPAAIMGASAGLFGTARAQYHLRQIAVNLNLLVMPGPEVMIATAQQKFNAEGVLTDEPTRERIRKLLEALAAWTRRLSG